MKAWQFTGTHEPFTQVELPDPEPGSEEVVLRVKAAGLCHSDVGIFEDEKWLSIMELPVVPGHEIVGVIESVGPGVTDYQAGDRVAVWPMPPDGRSYGYARNGGFADKVVASVDVLIPIPDDVPFDLAAAATDAGMTSHHALMHAGQVAAGMKVGIIGFGGLGQIGGRVAVLNGAELYVAEVKQDVWPGATEAGARRVVEDITELADEGLDVIVDFAGFGTTTAGAIEAVRVGGRVVQVGMGLLQATINTYALIIKQVQLVGSMGGGKADIESVLRWMSSGDLNPVVQHTDFAGIAEGIGRLKRDEVRGRLVAQYE